jgi:hypothetical protein
MSSIVVNGDTSGSVTLSAPTVAGTVTVTLPATSGTMAVSGGSTSFTNLAYTGTLTGNGGIMNIGSGQVYKDASGNVGIGTSSPAAKLDVRAATAVLQVKSDTGTNPVYQTFNNTGGDFYIGREDSTGGAFGTTAAYASVFYASGAYPMVFFTNAIARMRIDSSGNLLVGTTDGTKGALTVGKAAPSSAYGQICALSPTAGDSATSGMSVVKYANDSTTAQVLMRFLINQGAAGQGQINANGANTAAFGSYSDSRLKENIVDLPSQLDSIMALRPVEYDYIESMGGGHQIGFVAQEVQAIYPDLVGEDAEGMLTLTDMNKNDARLIKCIQEQQTLITALTTRITALESK